MKVAKQGYSFSSVTAPGVFIAYELPNDARAASIHDWR